MDNADSLLAESIAGATRGERTQQRRLAAVVADPHQRALTFALTDEVLRLDDHRRAALRFRAVLRDLGVPRSLRLVDRVQLRVGGWLAGVLPGVVMPLVRSRLIRESNGVVLPADDPAFARYVRRRSVEGFDLNVNVLGEAILSDAEAQVRLQMVLDRVARPDVNYVSLKISSVVANLDVLAFDHSVDEICTRLRALYRAAAGAVPTTFVNLDMEEYRDLPLTLAAMTRVLDEPEFGGLHAGVVLQAYLPDSHIAGEWLCEWATARHQRAGGTLKVRIVKGANLGMERVEAEQHGWTQAPYATKEEVDASFKRLVLHTLDDRWAPAVTVGFASHNLFDIAWALRLPAAQRARLQFEMLEGMAPAQARAVRAQAGSVLLYAPVVRSDDLPASIAYLTRRLDENTAPENFMRALFTLRPGSAEWAEQRARFDAAVALIDTVATTPRRVQDRSVAFDAGSAEAAFRNAADTDWAQAANRVWLAEHMAALGDTVLNDTVLNDTGLVPTPRADDVDRAVVAAVAAGSRWAATPAAARRTLLFAVADEMERSRGRTLALMARTACKTVAEGDPEVSEAVAFARYYAWCTHAVEERSARGRVFTPHGVVLVASPWNFPYAIPAGGVLAALAAGNAVILKPAPEVRAVAQELVEQMWRAGVPRDLLHYLPTDDDEVGTKLVTHDGVDTVVLTGAYETAQLFRRWKPSLRLLGETSGKNALVITAAADEDAAIKDLVRSAFGHAGQKCSAVSLAIVEASLYDDERFMRRLAEAVRSVRVGAATDLATMTGPLVGAPSDKLLRALTRLDDGERWLVEPECLNAQGDGVFGRLWRPGVKVGVRAGSWFHRTECFGPVLGVMRANDLDHALEMQNDVEFGLTGGIHSLDEREVAHWLERVEVGNAYVNRPTTGAIVQRQPFGGWKRSSVGCGPKAGGPFYVEAFGDWHLAEGCEPDGEAEFRAVWRECFAAEHDPSGLRSESNVLRYRPLPAVDLYVAPDADPAAVEIARLAASVAGVHPTLVVSPATGTAECVRVIGSITDDGLAACHAAGVEVDLVQPVADAHIELRRWVREQAVSTTRHRHGRLVD